MRNALKVDKTRKGVKEDQLCAEDRKDMVISQVESY